VFTPHPFELLILLLWLAVPFAVYWLIRLAVRHGVMDAHRRLPAHRPEVESAE
jgi:hypothetical protein